MAKEVKEQQAQEKKQEKKDEFSISFSEDELKALGSVGVNGRNPDSCRGFCLSFFEAFLNALPPGQEFTSGDILRKLRKNKTLYEKFKNTVSPGVDPEKYFRRHWQTFQKEACAKGLLKRRKTVNKYVIYTKV